MNWQQEQLQELLNIIERKLKIDMNKIKKLFSGELKVINIGVESFYNDLKKLGVDVIQVNWKPPAMGKEYLIKILEKIKKS